MNKTDRISRQLKDVLRRFVKGRATDKEMEFLSSLEQYQDNHRNDFQSLSPEERQRIKESIWEGVLEEKEERGFTRRRHFYRYAAALLVGLTVTALLFTLNPDKEAAESFSSSKEVSADLPPGGNRAILTLPDGASLRLSNEQTGLRVGEELAYLDGTSLSGLVFRDQLVSLSLETPRGGTYCVVLDDGTEVWLNAASQLRYPNRFEGGQRVVQLEGEAYFNVTKTGTPFFVETAHQRIEVLGTQFNVSAYGDDPATVTTLVTGSVDVRNLLSNHATRLRPGEQTILEGNSNTRRRVDVSEYTAWKEGQFYFNNMPLRTILAQLTRWYDFELSGDPVPDLHFQGGIRRDVPLSEVLAMLEATTDAIHFEIEDKKLFLYARKR